MPLMTSLERDGELVPLTWDWWQLDALEQFIRQEDGEKPWAYGEDPEVFRSPGQEQLHNQVGHYIFKQWHRLPNPYVKYDPQKGYEPKHYLVVQPGDKYRMWRQSR